MATPTLKSLFDKVVADIEAELGVTIAPTGPSFLRAFAAVLAGVLKLVYLSGAKVQKNVFVDTADPEAEGGTLERFGRIKLQRSRFSATQGRYDCTFTGTPAATIPIGTLYKSDDTALSPAKIFATTALITIGGGGTATGEVRSLEGGTQTRLQVGDGLRAVSPILNVDSPIVVTAETVIPVDRETIEAYRQAIVDSFRLEPKGGAPADYRLWSSDAQGVRRVFSFTRGGADINTVDIFVEATIADSTDGKGTPTAQILSDVEDIIEFDPDTTLPLNQRGRRPINVVPVVSAITVIDIDIVISGANGFTAADEDLVEQQVDLFLQDIRPFVTGADVISERADVLSVNSLIVVVQQTVGSNKTFDSLTFTADGIPVAVSRQFLQGDIPWFNSITYI